MLIVGRVAMSGNGHRLACLQKALGRSAVMRVRFPSTEQRKYGPPDNLGGSFALS